MEKYAMYLRKSRADLEAEKLGEGETLARHKKILTALAVQKNLYIEKIYQEIVSGDTIAARPQIQSLINDCYAGKYRGIICMDVDRLSRGNQADMQTIMDCLKYGNCREGLLCVTPTKTYDVAHNTDDEEYMEFVLFLSRREYKTIRKRLERGKRQSVIEGNYVPSTRPYGYNILKTRTGRTLTPDPEESKVVQMIFDWAGNQGLRPKAIVNKLYAMGIPTCTGLPEWQEAAVKTILSNPVYIGKVRWNRMVTTKQMKNGEVTTRRVNMKGTDLYMEYDGKHPAIIDEDLFHRAGDRYSYHRATKIRPLKNPLAGLLKCGKCGRTMTYQFKTHQSAAPRFHHPYMESCKVKSVYAMDVINATVASLKAHLHEFEIDMDNLPQVDENSIQDQIEHIQRMIAGADAKLKKLYDAWENGILSDNEFIERKSMHLDNIEKLKQKITELNDVIPEQEEIEERTYLLSDALNALLDENLDAEIKNEYLKRIINKIDFSRENNEQFTLDIYIK